MKQPKRLKRNEKEFLATKGLNPENWMVRQRYEDKLELVNKISGNKKILCYR